MSVRILAYIDFDSVNLSSQCETEGTPSTTGM